MSFLEFFAKKKKIKRNLRDFRLLIRNIDVEGTGKKIYYLLKNGRINKKDENGFYPIHYSVVNAEFLSFLIDYGVKTNVRDKDQNTILHHAVIKGNLESVLLILEKDRRLINLKNKFGDTSLHTAVKNKKYPILRVLLENGASLKIKNNKGITPFGLALRNKDMKAIEIMDDFVEF